MKYPNKLANTLIKELYSSIKSGNFDNAYKIIENVITKKTSFNENIYPIACVHFAVGYLEIVEHEMSNISFTSSREDNEKEIINLIKTLKKLLGILNQYEQSFHDIKYIISNRATTYRLIYDLNYVLKYHIQSTSDNEITFSKMNSIYEIDGDLKKSIDLYWRRYEEIEDINERYNIVNNLSISLSRAGRYCEALILYKKNIVQSPNRWQSKICFNDTLEVLKRESLLSDTLSLYYKKAIYLKDCLEFDLTVVQRNQLSLKFAIEQINIEQSGKKFDNETIEEYKINEYKDFNNFSAYRKFVLENDLSLNEHSLYCFCGLSKKDNLKIGQINGSTHFHKLFIDIDAIANRIISEYLFSRQLYYNYLINEINDSNDIEYSIIEKTNKIDLTGYKIENLRASFRYAYSILDKIGNGIKLLFNINYEPYLYFENFFDNNVIKSVLKNNGNIHLTALYSLSLDLNKDVGAFKKYKQIRNQMEHSLYTINSEEEAKEFQTLTFEIVKLTRNAIFCFVYLIRTETIQK